MAQYRNEMEKLVHGYMDQLSEEDDTVLKRKEMNMGRMFLSMLYKMPIKKQKQYLDPSVPMREKIMTLYSNLINQSR